jgi:O-acetyl-ADP-ribose deacetylase (regulator of RNase III)
MLESCYKESLDLALEFELKTIAFCCISTGIYGYPKKKAAHVALHAVRHWLLDGDHQQHIERVIFCMFEDEEHEIYKNYIRYYFPIEEK